MFFDTAEGMVFRPPSEANSLILRLTIGCSHNGCSFCAMYRDVKFRIRPLPEIAALITQATALYPDARRIFLADGNALVLPNEQLLCIIDLLHQNFPKLSRITCYGGPKDILKKTAAELRDLKQAGLQIIYLGIESGDDQVLTNVNKGVTSQEMITAGRKVLDAGIKLSAMVILGLGGKEHTEEHALHTAKVINAIRPTMLSTLTLMLHEGTPLRNSADCKKFIPLSPYEYLLELQKMMEYININSTSPCIFRSNHVSNLLPLAGNLPRDKALLLADLNKAIALFKSKSTPTYNDRGIF